MGLQYLISPAFTGIKHRILQKVSIKFFPQVISKGYDNINRVFKSEGVKTPNWENDMKIQRIRGLKSQSGIATALLVGLIAFVLIIVAAGVWAAKNYNVLIARGITAGMNAVINGSDIPEEEKAEVTRIISRLKEGYLADEITMAELGLVMEAMGSCPALPIGLVVQFEQSYVTPSGLSGEEKEAAGLHLNRLARGLTDGGIDWAVIEHILDPISDTKADGNRQLRSPERVTDHEILEVLVTAKEFADAAGMSEEMVNIDISDEFLKSVEQALGRSLA